MNGDNKDWTICSVIDWTEDYFARNGIPEPRLEAEVLLSSIMNCPRLELNLRKDEKVPPKKLSLFGLYILERKKRRPLAYILGEKEFMGLSFKVNPNTLIPRPETELLVEEALSRLKGKKGAVVAEIGTGSGNIAVSIAKLGDVERVYSSDISSDALFVAQENACRHGVAGKVVLRHGDMFRAFSAENIAGCVDMVVSNPPYVAQSEMSELAPELDFEPDIALYAGADGMEMYRRLAAEAGEYLKPGGLMVLEMNAKRSGTAREIFESAGYAVEALLKDYAGLDRILTLRKANG